MILHVGSKNPIKLDAVRNTVLLYPKLFPHPEVTGIEVAVEEFGHPKNIHETVQGAIERAKKAFYKCVFSFGIEGGLMKVQQARSGFMEVGACAIYDGRNVHLGLSPAFEFPKAVTKLIRSNKADASQAFKQLGHTRYEKLGAQGGGIINIMTNGRLTREDLTKYSIMMALTQLEKPELFE